VLAGAETVIQNLRPAIVLEVGIEPDQDRDKVKSLLEHHSYTMAGVILPHGIIEPSWDDYLGKAGVFSDGFVNLLFMSG